MARLIDAEAFKQYCNDGFKKAMAMFEGENLSLEMQLKVALAEQITTDFCLDIDEQPTVDAVPVTRCKDCKHYIAPSVFDKKSYCSVMAGLEGPKPDDFCSYGELREDKKMEE